MLLGSVARELDDCGLCTHPLSQQNSESVGRLLKTARIGLDLRGADLLPILATISALAVLPDWPHHNLTDPSYWGVLGFVILVVRLLWLRGPDWSRGSANRLTILAFLVLVPAVYVANWLRFGGSYVQLGIELAGEPLNTELLLQ